MNATEMEVRKLPSLLLHVLFPVAFARAVSRCILKLLEVFSLFDFSSVHLESLTVHFTFFQPTGIVTE